MYRNLSFSRINFNSFGVKMCLWRWAGTLLLSNIIVHRIKFTHMLGQFWKTKKRQVMFGIYHYVFLSSNIWKYLIFSPKTRCDQFKSFRCTNLSNREKIHCRIPSSFTGRWPSNWTMNAWSSHFTWIIIVLFS